MTNVLVDGDEDREARVRAALDLARTPVGRLSCIDVALLSVNAGDCSSPEIDAAGPSFIRGH